MGHWTHCLSHLYVITSVLPVAEEEDHKHYPDNQASVLSCVFYADVPITFEGYNVVSQRLIKSD